MPISFGRNKTKVQPTEEVEVEEQDDYDMEALKKYLFDTVARVGVGPGRRSAYNDGDQIINYSDVIEILEDAGENPHAVIESALRKFKPKSVAKSTPAPSVSHKATSSDSKPILSPDGSMQYVDGEWLPVEEEEATDSYLPRHGAGPEYAPDTKSWNGACFELGKALAPHVDAEDMIQLAAEDAIAATETERGSIAHIRPIVALLAGIVGGSEATEMLEISARENERRAAFAKKGR